MPLIPYDEERELLQDFGGHEPENGDAILVALRKEQVSQVRGVVLSVQDILNTIPREQRIILKGTQEAHG